MYTGSKIIREDGKEFTVIELSHWSLIRAEDDEEDHVKWGGGVKEEIYVSAVKGYKYIFTARKSET